jgi:hypothetical protein
VVDPTPAPANDTEKDVSGGKVRELTKMRQMTDRLFFQKVLQKSHQNPTKIPTTPKTVVALDDVM